MPSIKVKRTAGLWRELKKRELANAFRASPEGRQLIRPNVRVSLPKRLTRQQNEWLKSEVLQFGLVRALRRRKYSAGKLERIIGEEGSLSRLATPLFNKEVKENIVSSAVGAGFSAGEFRQFLKSPYFKELAGKLNEELSSPDFNRSIFRNWLYVKVDKAVTGFLMQKLSDAFVRKGAKK